MTTASASTPATASTDPAVRTFVIAAHGDRDMVAWLMDHGAGDLTITDYRGLTPVAAAEADGQKEIAGLLRGGLKRAACETLDSTGHAVGRQGYRDEATLTLPL